MKALSKYAKIFDETNIYWSNEVTHNEMFLRLQQIYANDLLHSEKTIFLNDMYKKLGLSKTKDGCVVGWHYDEENPIGDNEILFEFEQIPDRPNCFVIDFNVDGDVRDYLED